MAYGTLRNLPVPETAKVALDHAVDESDQPQQSEDRHGQNQHRHADGVDLGGDHRGVKVPLRAPDEVRSLLLKQGFLSRRVFYLGPVHPGFDSGLLIERLVQLPGQPYRKFDRLVDP